MIPSLTLLVVLVLIGAAAWAWCVLRYEAGGMVGLGQYRGFDLYEATGDTAHQFSPRDRVIVVIHTGRMLTWALDVEQAKAMIDGALAKQQKGAA